MHLQFPRSKFTRSAIALHAHAGVGGEGGSDDGGSGGEGSGDGSADAGEESRRIEVIKPALTLRTFDLPRLTATNKYEGLVKAATGCD